MQRAESSRNTECVKESFEKYLSPLLAFIQNTYFRVTQYRKMQSIPLNSPLIAPRCAPSAPQLIRHDNTPSTLTLPPLPAILALPPLLILNRRVDNMHPIRLFQLQRAALLGFEVYDWRWSGGGGGAGFGEFGWWVGWCGRVVERIAL